MKLSEFLDQKDKIKNTDEQSPPPSITAKKKPLRVLRTRPTPNPDALQYVLNAPVLDYGKKSYSSKAESVGDKLAEALFDIKGVCNVYVMENFLTVTKDANIDWTPLSGHVWKCIDAHVTIYAIDEKDKPPEVDTGNYQGLSHDERLQAIELVLNRSIRANLARDGGGVELKGLDGNEVSVHYQGACGSCPTSTTGTLKFIEQLLRQQLHPELQVKSV